MSLRSSVLLLLALLSTVAVGGCVQRSGSTPSGSLPMGPIYGPHVAAQTFGPRNLPLVGIDVRLATYARANQGVVTLRLKADRESSADLRTITVDASAIRDGAPHRFSFARIASPSPSLAIVVESSATDEDNAVAVWSYVGEAIGGAGAFYDDEPQETVLAITPVYEESLAAAAIGQLGALSRAGTAPWLLVIMTLLPGFALSSLFLRRGWSLTDRLAAAPAFAVAAIPLVVLWMSQWPSPAATVTFGAGFLALAAVASPATRRPSETGGLTPAAAPATTARSLSIAGFASFAAALAAVGAGLLVRAVALDGMVVPPGADAYHHALITQLISEQGSVPRSYLPYAPIASYAYHFGFHALSAAAAVLSGQTAFAATAATALWLNGLIALSVFFCARALRMGDAAAVAAAVMVALVSPYPAGLLDLARFPQTAGLVILPVAAALILRRAGVAGADQDAEGFSGSVGRVGEDWRNDLRELGAIAMLGAGLFVTHYRIAMALAGLAVLAIGWSVVRRVILGGGPSPQPSPRGRGGWLFALGALLLMAVMIGPWLVRMAQDFTLGINGSSGRYGPEYFSLERLGDGLHHPAFWPVLVVGLLGAALAAVQRRAAIALLAVWAGLLIGLSSPYWLSVPGAGALDSVTVFGMLFFPAAIGAGYLAQISKQLVDRAQPGLGITVVGVGLCAAALCGSLQIPPLFRANDPLVDPGDLRAARWIDTSLPASAKLLVNSQIRRWNPDYVVPTDGGYWLPLLAHRETTLLPLVYAGERGVPAAELALMERISRASGRISDPETVSLLRSAGVTHVYLGVRGGPIDEAMMSESLFYRAIYQRGGASIYEVAPAGQYP